MFISTLPSSEIALDEKMDMARYKCTIYHMSSVFYTHLYDEFEEYARNCAKGYPYFHFLIPRDSHMSGLVYIFPDEEMKKKFISENKEKVELHKETINKSFYT